MSKHVIHTLNFSINNWTHLYSLEQAILRAEEVTGKSLTIEGTVRNSRLLDQKDAGIRIHFYQVDGTPHYRKSDHEGIIIGTLSCNENALEASVPVDGKVFEELRKNLMEYIDIDGIHIVVTLGLSVDDQWHKQQTADIVKLDYAMRGDA